MSKFARNLNHITEVPWPIVTKSLVNQVRKKTVYISCYSWQDYLIAGESRPIVMVKRLSGTSVNVLSLSGHINYHKKDSLCRVKLGVVGRSLEYKQEGTGKDMFERDIYYALDRKVSDNSFSQVGSIRFLVDEYGTIQLNTNCEDNIEEDFKMYQSPTGEVIPAVGDVILNLECLKGVVDASFTMSYIIEE